MRPFIALAVAGAVAFGTAGAASADCATASPDAITSKQAQATSGSDQQAASDAKGIAEDGQHTPMETDPNAPGVTKAEGGTTTNTQKAEAEIAAGAGTDPTTTAATTGSDMKAGDTACPG